LVKLVVPILKGVNRFSWIFSFSGQNADFWPLSKFKYRLTLHRGVLPVKKTNTNKHKTPYFRTYNRRALFNLSHTLHGDRGR